MQDLDKVENLDDYALKTLTTMLRLVLAKPYFSHTMVLFVSG